MNKNMLITLSKKLIFPFFGSLKSRLVIANKKIIKIKLRTMIMTTPMFRLPVVFSSLLYKNPENQRIIKVTKLK